eukprot:TRINITY_DN9633_c0_g1_i2.p3 TRINITY_DN9633_c0_g1~~TRINITY_DN9633_c0_g1_i2.p3  ORF type:complete len:113 (+),score=29.86 TRINITY_DN9633_c0_g1_i2:629-967(+)
MLSTVKVIGPIASHMQHFSFGALSDPAAQDLLLQQLQLQLRQQNDDASPLSCLVPATESQLLRQLLLTPVRKKRFCCFVAAMMLLATTSARLAQIVLSHAFQSPPHLLPDCS